MEEIRKLWNPVTRQKLEQQEREAREQQEHEAEARCACGGESELRPPLCRRRGAGVNLSVSCV